ncbi:hypothetical protein BDR04DRAFT_1109718, partial [Suillus decipiens]
MLNAGRMKHASKVNRRCQSATQPWKKSRSTTRGVFCAVRGLWHQTVVWELFNICIRTFKKKIPG